MAGGAIKLDKGQILFREGDVSDAMYVIKKGRIAITKAKGSKDIILAELKPGEMLGEMAFFDNKPRSAGAKASIEAEVISLPFSALHAQFKTFPEWLRAMVKTVNSHLRSANQRIKNLENLQEEGEELFTPHTITKFCAILTLLAHKAGEKTEEGIVVPSGMLRNYTIQIFQQPTHKMQKLMSALQELGVCKVEDLGEGRQKITLFKHEMLDGFVDWYNEYLFKEESKRITVEERFLPTIKALIFYGEKETPDDKNIVKLDLAKVRDDSMKDLGYVVDLADTDPLIEKGLCNDKQTGGEGEVTMTYDLAELKRIFPYWEIVYTLRKIPSGR